MEKGNHFFSQIAAIGYIHTIDTYYDMKIYYIRNQTTFFEIKQELYKKTKKAINKNNTKKFIEMKKPT